MSPEQASGFDVDARGDIFSLGVVLYESLAGRRPFAGATSLETLQAIIHRPAEPLARLCPELPVGLRLTVEKALEKDPADRYQSARELMIDLRREANKVTADGVSAPAHPRWRTLFHRRQHRGGHLAGYLQIAIDQRPDSSASPCRAIALFGCRCSNCSRTSRAFADSPVATYARAKFA